MVRRASAVLAAAQLLAGCTGLLSGPETPSLSLQQSTHDLSFACTDGALAPSSLSRLSKAQYENTLHDLLAAQLPNDVDALWPIVQGALAPLPDDTISKVSPFSSMDQSVSQQHVDTYYALGQTVAQLLTQDDAHVASLLSCQGGESDDDCVKRFFGTFGRRAFRHTPNAAELDFLNTVYDASGIDKTALADVITVMLNAPQFLYRVEFGDQPVASKAGAFTLSGAELATRLSYHFWQTMPDDTLLANAESGALVDDKGYDEAVATLRDDPRSEAGLRVFVNEWLQLAQLRDPSTLDGDPTYEAFVGQDLPSPDLRDDMIQEVEDSFVFHVERDDKFSAWFVSPYSFAKSDELAAIYQSEKWDGQNAEPPRFPQGQRSGLLTRAALLATGQVATRPILKGVFIRTSILCDRVGAPPANATSIPASLSSTMTTRQVVETLTQQPGSACAGCHPTLINPLGFATENFDALGRIRSAEVLFSSEGSELGQLPVQTVSTPRIWPDDDTVSQGAADLTQLIMESGKAEACFARQYIRFAYGRTEDDVIDGCALESVRSALEGGQGLQQALKAPVLRPEFRQRYVGEVQ